MDELEDLLAQHASVTMNLGLKDHSVSRRDALMGQSLAEKDRAEARNFTRRGDGVAPSPTRLDSTRSHAGPPGPCEGAEADLRQQPGRGSSEQAHDTVHAPLGSLGQPLADASSIGAAVGHQGHGAQEGRQKRPGRAVVRRSAHRAALEGGARLRRLPAQGAARRRNRVEAGGRARGLGLGCEGHRRGCGSSEQAHDTMCKDVWWAVAACLPVAL